ncbi:histidinol-phosphate aminotransferase [Viridothelium virens]|uniref:histidinol-phosphate transaminase n=1 Tax=Viridothelium virens TaxID=1048519 RepID=A0A6A6GVY7_VIRVR|nr:histidinol-phosphate aminotransferase [Viridothelium virens]
MASNKGGFDLQTCVRPNILKLQPYRCARDDYKDDGTNILLDANENAYGPPSYISGQGKKAIEVTGVDLHELNRYPDPHQRDLKQLLCNLRNTHAHTPSNLTPDNLFVGVGSDEAIDALQRCFCVPGRDKVLICPPTYGMYTVSACVNDLSVVSVPLDPHDFSLRPSAINAQLSADPTIKLIFICSPGNPTGRLIQKSAIETVLRHSTWNGIVALDEAYVDFAAEGASLAEWVLEWPNLVVMQTLSKAFGLAGIRLGAAFASAGVARLLNNFKAPYNVSDPTSQIASAALGKEGLASMRVNRGKILEQRERLLVELMKIPGVGRLLGGLDSNFLLVEMLDGPRDQGGRPSNQTALKVYESLAEHHQVVVRFRGKEPGCLGCLRITIGTESEVNKFLERITVVLAGILDGREQVNGVAEEVRKENQANGVVA